MPSLRQIKQRKLAALAASRRVAEAPVGVTSPSPAGAEPQRKSPEQVAADLMLVQLTEHKKELKAIESIEKKIEAKDKMLGGYRDWIAGLVEKPGSLPEGEPQDVLTTVMLWEIDTGNYGYALDLYEIVRSRNIPLPAQFDRKPDCLVTEEIANAALAANRDDESFDRNILDRLADLTGDADMPDEVKAKLHRARAEALQHEAVALDGEGGEAADGPAGQYRALLDEALAEAKRALKLDDNSGVKGTIRDLERALKKLNPEENTQ